MKRETSPGGQSRKVPGSQGRWSWQVCVNYRAIAVTWFKNRCQLLRNVAGRCGEKTWLLCGWLGQPRKQCVRHLDISRGLLEYFQEAWYNWRHRPYVLNSTCLAQTFQTSKQCSQHLNQGFCSVLYLFLPLDSFEWYTLFFQYVRTNVRILHWDVHMYLHALTYIRLWTQTRSECSNVQVEP